MIIYPKPLCRLKTLVALAEKCLYGNCSDNCKYKNYIDCKNAMKVDMLYYLRQTLEKSGKGQK